MPPVKIPRKAKDPKKTIGRLLAYLKQYQVTMILVVLCIIVSAIAMAAGSASLGTLVDDHIKPLLSQETPNYGPLLKYLCFMAVLYVLGIVSTFLYNYLMVEVGQGTQKKIRDEMFTHMQKLPIRYFDTHPAGDVMSRYTADIDTLRQMITQALPNCVSSIATMVTVFALMLKASPILTGVVVLTAAAILFITKTVAMHSAKFFIGQQRALGAVNGYVEEMISGPRVVKVFCREDIC